MKALGRYELLRPLARGGMAEVYLARRRVAGVEKRLVIKRMRREHSRDPRFLDLFVREAQLSMSLVQPNIVPVFDFGRIGDDVFLAMEYIDGKDLGSSLARDRSAGLPPIVAAFIAAECCQALDHAHRRRDASTPEGVIHRDVTPRNVLLSWAGDVLLADFGIAAVVGQAAGDTMGTPGYMAPEQAQGGAIDARADVYALGIVLWEAVTGVHVRPTGSRAEAIAAAKTGALPAIPDTIPPALAEVIRRATALAPGDRYDSARTMADALDGFLVAERARDGGPTPTRRLGDWLRARWGSDRAEPVAELTDEPGHMVTFLDDGADGVRSPTERSMAETAASGPPLPAIAPPPAVVAARASSRRRARTGWLVLAGVAVGGVVIASSLRHDSPASAVPRPVDPVTAAQAAGAGLDPRPAEPPQPAAPEPTPPVPTPPVVAPTPTPAVVPTTEPARIKRKPPTPAPVAEAIKRPITLGAVPWANITVDDDPTSHETPATLQLTVGPHRVTYTNPQLGVVRTVTVTVPAEGDARHVETLR